MGRAHQEQKQKEKLNPLGPNAQTVILGVILEVEFFRVGHGLDRKSDHERTPAAGVVELGFRVQGLGIGV